MIKEQTSDPLWGGVSKNMSNKSIAEINVLKEQAKKDRQKKAAAYYASQTFKCSDDMKFNLQQIQPNEGTFLSNTIKNVLGEYKWFEKAIQSKKSHLYLGLDNTVPGTPEVKDIEIDAGAGAGGLFSKINKKAIDHEAHEQEKISRHEFSKQHKRSKPPELSVTKNKTIDKLNSDVEKILKEMTQQAIPLLTDIETPVKVNNEFAFPVDAISENVNTKVPQSKANEEEIASRNICKVEEDIDLKPEIIDSSYMAESFARLSKDDVKLDICNKQKKKASPILHPFSPETLKSKSEANFLIVSRDTAPFSLNTSYDTHKSKSVENIGGEYINVNEHTDNVLSKDILNIKDVALNNISTSKEFISKSVLDNPVHTFPSLLSSSDHTILDPSTMTFLIEKPVSPFAQPLFDDLDISNTSNDHLIDILAPQEIPKILNTDTTEAVSVTAGQHVENLNIDWNTDQNPSLILGKKMKGVGNLYQKDRIHKPIDNTSRTSKTNIEENNKLALKINETKDKAKSKTTRQNLQTNSQEVVIPTMPTFPMSENIFQSLNKKRKISKNSDNQNDNFFKETLSTNLENNKSTDIIPDRFIKEEDIKVESPQNENTVSQPDNKSRLAQKKMGDTVIIDDDMNSTAEVQSLPETFLVSENVSLNKNSVPSSHDILNQFTMSPTNAIISPMSSPKSEPSSSLQCSMQQDSGVYSLPSDSNQSQQANSSLTLKVDVKEEEDENGLSDMEIGTPVDEKPIILNEIPIPPQSSKIFITDHIVNLDKTNHNKSQQKRKYTNETELNKKKVDHCSGSTTDSIDRLQKLTVKIPLKAIRLKKKKEKNTYINNRKVGERNSEIIPQSPHKNIHNHAAVSKKKQKKLLEKLDADKNIISKVTNNHVNVNDNNKATFSSRDTDQEKLVVKIHLSKLKRTLIKDLSNQVKEEEDLEKRNTSILKPEHSLARDNTPNLQSSSTSKHSENEKSKKKRGRPPKHDASSKKILNNSKGQQDNTSISENHSPQLEKRSRKTCFEIKEVLLKPSRLESYKTSYLQYFDEGQRKKRVADSLKDPMQKVREYIEAVLNYVQFMIGSEVASQKNGKNGTDSQLRICSDCIKLVDFVVRHYFHKNQSDPNNVKFSYLCLLLQSMFYMKLFKLRKDLVYKQSKVLSEYYKQYRNKPGPSPQVNNRSASPHQSPGPSPGKGFAVSSDHSSGSSVGSVNNVTTISIPIDMNEKAQQYFQETKYLLTAHRFWDDAERNSMGCQDFVEKLISKSGCLTMQSPLLHVYEYINFGLELIKESAVT